MTKSIVIVVVVSIIVGVLFWQFGGNLFSKTVVEDKVVELKYWGIAEEEPAVRPIIAAYENSHPKVKISYEKQTLLNYRTRVQTQLRADQGPDILEIHSSWVPMFTGDLTPSPDSVEKVSNFTQTFYPVAKETLLSGNQVYGLPLEVNGLGLYYNEDILQGVGMGVPKSWPEFVEAARRVTVRNQQGQIQTAGAALGSTNNVDFWPEILGLLFFQQPEGNLERPANKDGMEVMQFYTSFITDPKNKTWDVTLPSSTQMFKEGRLAFYFAPVSKIEEMQRENPNLHFKVASVPQLPGRSVNYGSFWVGAVSSHSTHPKEAWEFLKFLASAESLQYLYQQHSQNQSIGRVYPRADMAGILVADPYVGAYVAQGAYYKSWFLNSGTGDKGLNDEMISLYEIAVSGVLQGRDSLSMLQEAQSGITQVLGKYTRPPTVAPVR